VGKNIPVETVDGIIRSLEIEIAGRRDGEVDLLVPTYRVDVQRPCDVVEDVLRIYGYNNVELSQNLRASLSFKTITDKSNELRELISNQLSSTGFNEILNNSLTAESYFDTLVDEHHAPVKLLNPLSSDLNVMRMTLLFGGLESIEHNINRRDADLMLYEFGNVYNLDPSVDVSDKPLSPYSEGARLGLWLTGNIRTGNWARPDEKATFFDLKAIVANIFDRLGISAREIELKPVDSCPIYASALDVVTRAGKKLGTMGSVNKAMLRKCDIKQDVLYAELDWNAIVKLAVKKKVTYSPLPKTQPVKRDLALLIDKSVTMAQIEQIVRESEKRMLRDVTLFDVYEGKNLEAGKKSYAIAITLQDDEKTLQDKQIEAVMNKIITNLTTKLGASLR
ncbi:MAG: phenylalanine--tRNA ligase subunit beta, partial [Muribaculaceae bacterium]|nr:phenylalanine--tRNA ligase subunit beta [Muribaculaceae bacterium]